MGFPGSSPGKECACNAQDLGSICELEISPGEGNSYPLQDSGLENFMDCIVHGVAKSQTRLSHFHFHWCWDRLRVGGEEGDRGWNGWMASSTERTWVWACLTPGDSEGQGSLACCSPWGRKKLDTTEQLNNNKYYSLFLLLRLYWFPKGLCYFILCHNIWMYWFYFCEPIQSILSLF